MCIQCSIACKCLFKFRELVKSLRKLREKVFQLAKRLSRSDGFVTFRHVSGRCGGRHRCLVISVRETLFGMRSERIL